MKRGLLGLAVIAAFVVFSGSVYADSIDFQLTQTSSGSVSYAGGTTPLVITDAAVDQVKNTGTGTTFGLQGSCATYACFSLTSGNLTGSNSTSWFFGPGGSVSIVGGSASTSPTIASSTTLLSGTVASATVIYSVTGTQVSVAVIPNTVDLTLLSNLGFTYTGGYTGTLNYSFTTASSMTPPNGFTSSVMGSGDLTDVTPEPATLGLLGVGLLGLGLMGLSRKKRREA